MNNKFDWIPIFEEYANKILEYKNDRQNLLKKMEKVFESCQLKYPLVYQNEKKTDIDPFAMYSVFNRGITWDNKKKVLEEIKVVFGLQCNVPSTFDGIPVFNNQNIWISDESNTERCDLIWDIFEHAINYADEKEDESSFCQCWDKLIEINGMQWRISVGLYWARPNFFLNLDTTNRNKLVNGNLVNSQLIEDAGRFKKMPEAKKYLNLCKQFNEEIKSGMYSFGSFAEFSNLAYTEKSEQVITEQPKIQYWMYSPGSQASQWDECVQNSIMVLGWDWLGDLKKIKDATGMQKLFQEHNNDQASHSNDVLANWEFCNVVKPGDIIFAKKGTKTILGRGVVESDYCFDDSRKEYKHVRKVNWTNVGEWEHPVDGNVVQKTLTNITQYDGYAEKIDSMFTAEEIQPVLNDIQIEESVEIYSEEDFLKDVYISKSKLHSITHLLKKKKNIILQGAPGVGKTFAAKRLAYVMMGTKKEENIELIQFHQNYSYEDFVMGYKPKDDSFVLKNGIFFEFCKKAKNNPEESYFFIIDEINRGNMSKIFGELLMAIENEYRGKSVTLAYTQEKYFVPENVYIIGMMNTADRSLALIDYALRRRFSFIDMEPGFDSEGFKEYQKGLNSSVFDNTISKIKELNKDIKEDTSLGSGFCIGHSYFCNMEKCTNIELKEILVYDIIPTLKEYWFDNHEKCLEWENKLKGVVNE